MEYLLLLIFPAIIGVMLCVQRWFFKEISPLMPRAVKALLIAFSAVVLVMLFLQR